MNRGAFVAVALSIVACEPRVERPFPEAREGCAIVELPSTEPTGWTMCGEGCLRLALGDGRDRLDSVVGASDGDGRTLAFIRARVDGYELRVEDLDAERTVYGARKTGGRRGCLLSVVGVEPDGAVLGFDQRSEEAGHRHVWRHTRAGTIVDSADDRVVLETSVGGGHVAVTYTRREVEVDGRVVYEAPTGWVTSLTATETGVYFVVDRRLHRWSDDGGVEALPLEGEDLATDGHDLVWRSGDALVAASVPELRPRRLRGLPDDARVGPGVVGGGHALHLELLDDGSRRLVRTRLADGRTRVITHPSPPLEFGAPLYVDDVELAVQEVAPPSFRSADRLRHGQVYGVLRLRAL